MSFNFLFLRANMQCLNNNSYNLCMYVHYNTIDAVVKDNIHAKHNYTDRSVKYHESGINGKSYT